MMQQYCSVHSKPCITTACIHFSEGAATIETFIDSKYIHHKEPSCKLWKN